ncbi:MAG: amidohydrolase family protein [Bacteroidota bacterium]|nr:amidohydrolase family protein [Bacteroidota bacterium]
MKIKLFIYLFMLFPIINLAQKPTLYIGGTLHIGDGTKIETSAISVLNGKFDLVADLSNIRIDPDAFDTIIRLYGKHIYPGFILPNTTLGITEIGAVRATHDFREVGEVNPNIRVLTAYNTDSKIIPTIRTNGVLLAQITPRGGLFSGQSSIFYLSGENWEDAVCKIDEGIHLYWPSIVKQHGWWGDPGERERNKIYEEKVTRIESILKKAKAYFEYHENIDLKMESMQGLFNGNKILYIHANYANDIRRSIQMIKHLNIKNCVLVGGEEVLSVTDIIKKHKVPIILNRIHRLPNTEDRPIDEPFIQPQKLKALDIKFCFSYSGSMEAMGSRNLPFSAGTAVSYGLNYEDAVRALSLDAAEIMGIGTDLGSVEIGKDATFFISTGDALDISTNNIEHIFMKGLSINIDNHQKKLYEKFK